MTEVPPSPDSWGNRLWTSPVMWALATWLWILSIHLESSGLLFKAMPGPRPGPVKATHLGVGACHKPPVLAALRARLEEVWGPEAAQRKKGLDLLGAEACGKV